jgi:hypothetical protein
MIAITFDLISDIFLYLRVNQAAKKKTLRQKTKLFTIIFVLNLSSTIKLKPIPYNFAFIHRCIVSLLRLNLIAI